MYKQLSQTFQAINKTIEAVHVTEPCSYELGGVTYVHNPGPDPDQDDNNPLDCYFFIEGGNIMCSPGESFRKLWQPKTAS